MAHVARRPGPLQSTYLVVLSSLIPYAFSTHTFVTFADLVDMRLRAPNVCEGVGWSVPRVVVSTYCCIVVGLVACLGLD
jgi:hypothetical protein